MAQFGGDASMPVAVIGMGCRFPGDATSPARLWELLVNGRSAWSEFPNDRINIDGFYHPSGNRQGSICFKGGHFLKDDVAAWDAPFFSTTAHEAAAMDPQQRILLEVSYEAFENAGIPIGKLPGSATAVYCGAFVKDYEQIVLRDPDYSPQYAATGNGIAIMSNRISWFYDLKGPSMTLDTGCSASLVGVHLACQSLRTGESTMAIAMGAGLILTPSTMMPMTALNFLSPDGKCFTFDERANGYGRGEGIGAVVLKPLENALRDNDTIRAIIRGSGVNQDGRTPGITMPSKDAQAINIRAVYKAADLGYDQTAYFEAHGTGTQAGDPTELGAISETFAETRSSDGPIFVGSVKTNIGHLEGCAGIAGFVKGVLMLENGLIPPNLYFEKVNPNIDLDAWKIKIPTCLTPWPMDGLRRVSINCFGFGGTNAHIILDDAFHYLAERNLDGKHHSVNLSPPTTPSLFDFGIEVSSQPSDLASNETPVPPAQRHKLYVLSSHEESGISRLCAAYSLYLEEKSSPELYDELEQLGSNLAYTLCCRRSQLPWKSFLVSPSVAKLPSQFEEDFWTPVRSSQTPNIAFIFSGQGAQWFGMGRELLRFERFSKSLEEADGYMKAIGSEWSLQTEFLKDEDTSIINLPQISQPLCTALQVALIDLLKYWGIEPHAVVGHSSGEIAAAYALGALSREDAWKLAFHRGRLTSAIKYRSPNLKGRMIAVAISKEKAEKFIGNLEGGTAVVACINSPESVTISGDESAVLELEKVFVSEGIFARLLKVENAYHSPHMKVIEYDYLQAIQDIQVLEVAPGRTMFSSVTGKSIDSQGLGPDYWARNLVSVVNFSEAMNCLLHCKNVKPKILLELGPHAVLQAPLSQILDMETRSKSRPVYVSMLYRGKDAVATSLEAVGHLWTHGYPANLELVSESSSEANLSALTDLPTYPWNHTKAYWHESHLGSAYRFRKYGRQDLIGAPTVEATFFEPQWRGFVRVSENPWVQDHQVQNTIIYPAAGMVVMVLEGARQIQDEGHRVEGYEISNMSINKAMIIPTSAHGLETKLNMKRHGSESSTDHREVEMFDFTIYSKILDAAWQKNCSGMLTIKYKPIVEASEVDNIPLDMKQYRQNYLSHKETCTETIPARQLYEALETIGMKYGSTFQNIKSVHKKDNISCTTVRIPDTKSRMPGKYEYPHLIHPATLDAIFQTVFVAGNEPMVPSHLLSLFISADFPEGAGQELGGYTNALRKGLRDATGNIVMFNGSWDKPKLIVKDLHFTALSTASDDAAERGFLPNHHNLCAELAWKEDVTTASPRLLSGWLELASYQNPAMNILDTCCENMYSMFSRLKSLGGRNETNPQFSKYTFTDTSDESFERCRDLLEDWPDYVDFKVLNRTTDLLEQGFKARSFDLVFADTPDVKFCKALRGLLKPRGNFVLISIAPGSENHVNRNEHAEEESDIRYERKALVDHSKPDTLFFDTEASKPDLILKDDFGRGYIEVFASDSKAKQSLRPSSREVLILVPANPSRKLHGLSVRLTEALLLAGAKVSCSQLTNPAICFSAKICLALLEVDSPLVSTWTDDEFQAFRSMISEINGCLWITSGGQMNSKSPFGAPITALFRTIRSEDPLKAIVTLDLDAETDLGSDLTGRVILSTFLKSFDSQSPSDEREYAERDGRIFIPRAMLEEQLSSRIEQDGKSHTPILEPFFQAERPLQLEVGTLGKLDSLHFITDHGALLPLGPREVEIRTHAVGVSQLDVATALGQTAQATIGSDVAGIVTRVGADLSMFKTGDRVITIVPGAFKTFVRNHESAVQRIGDEMSFQHASSLPTNYITALYAIVTIGRLQEGESILIHGGADKFVHAAVQIAKNAGAEIFITTTSSEERSILIEAYGLADDRVFDNRFNVFRRSSQESVFDLILNSFRGHLRIQALDCVQEYGRFIDIGMNRNENNDSLRQIPRLANVTYSTMDLSYIIKSNTSLISSLLKSTFEMVKAGIIHQSTPLKTFNFSNISVAFQEANKLKQTSKVVLETIEDDMVPVAPRDEHPLKLSPNATYVLIGGLGGLGRSLSGLLISHGATNLAFFSRSGAVSSVQNEFLSSLKSQNINFQVYQCDICDSPQVEAAIKKCADEMPPIRGAIQGAAVIRDAIFANMTYDDWVAATRPKIQGSWNLHLLLPQDLDFFVFLSSSAAVIGARGQANYAAGNAFQDSLAHYRRNKNLKAVSLDLCPILSVGMVAEDEATLDILRSSGILGMREKDFHILVKAALTGYTQDGHVTPAQVVVGTGTGGLIKQNAVADPYWHSSPMFSIMRGVDLPPSSSNSSSNNAVSMQDLLTASTSVKEATGIVMEGLVQLFAKSMNILPADLDTSKPANAYGVDSLVAVGTRNWILKEIGVDVSVFEILSENSIGQLAKTTARNCKYIAAELKEESEEKT